MSDISSTNQSNAGSNGLQGKLVASPDKSITHRAYMLASLSGKISKIRHPLKAEDCDATLKAVQTFGSKIVEQTPDSLSIQGTGLQSLQIPKGATIDCGNSGTMARLMCGLLAGQDDEVVLTGDSSLVKRPMDRVVIPLSQMGVQFLNSKGQPVVENSRLPLMVRGGSMLAPITYRLPVASAQVKSAILLAALGCRGTTSVIEPEITRDHSENMLKSVGADITISQTEARERQINLTGGVELNPIDITVPGDFSSAAFMIVSALLIPNSNVTVARVGINPTRSGLLEVLKSMGADLTITPSGEKANEPIADIQARHSNLEGVTVKADHARLMIDEYPILAMAAAVAKGTSRFEGLGELRAKETDRLSAIANGLAANGVETKEGKDWLEIKGSNKQVKGGGFIEAAHDHRIAMSFLILGLTAKEKISVQGKQSINTSYPEFFQNLATLGANLE